MSGAEVVARLRDLITERAIDFTRRAADITVDDTKAAASRRTGALEAGITHTEPSLVTQTRIQCTIESAVEYSKFQDEGTGIYGPSGVRIFPTHAKALRFDWPAAGGIVFAKSVAGSPGRHYFREPMPDRWRESLEKAKS